LTRFNVTNNAARIPLQVRQRVRDIKVSEPQPPKFIAHSTATQVNPQIVYESCQW